jgi:dUTP pyrophosphatase
MSEVNQEPGSDFVNPDIKNEFMTGVNEWQNKDFIFNPSRTYDYRGIPEDFTIKSQESITFIVKPWTVKFIKTNPEAKLPHQASEGAACSDLYSVEKVTIYPGKTKLIDTGLQVAHIPSGYRLDLFDRSGFRAKGIFGSSVGIIDEDYRGPLKVILFNSTDIPLEISVGDRIAQAALTQKNPVTYEFTEVYEDTERGAGGFGSTGRN